MDYLHKQCAMCKKNIDNNSLTQITISTSKGYVYFHRFCYFNYRTEGVNKTL